MGKFNRGDDFGGKRRFNKDRGFDRDERRERPSMHQAVCSACGKTCEVPFKPTGDKPVYCSFCFGRKEDSGGNRFERRDSNRQSFGDKPMFRAVCSTCGKDCEVPFRPTGDKPVYCNECFGQKERKSGGDKSVVSSDQNKKQFDAINSKLDYILKLLSAKNSGEKEETIKSPSTSSGQAQKHENMKAQKHEITKTPEKDVKKAKASKVVAPKKATVSKKPAKKAATKKKK